MEYGRASDTLRWLAREWNARAVSERASHIAMVECDESTLDASLSHLLALRPKAIIGPFTNPGLQAYVKNEAAAAIPTFAPTVDDPLLVEKPDAKRHVYSCTPNITRSVKAFQAAANVLTDFVATDRGVATAKVILAHTDETTDADIAGRISTDFTLDKGTVSTKVLSTNILQTSPSLLASAQAIALEKPDLVLLTAGIVGEELITNMELRWTALNGNARRPLYLVLGRAANLEESLKSMSDSEIMKGRVWALDWAGTTETDTNYQAAAGAIDANNAKFGPAPARAMDCAFASIFGGFAGAATAQGTMLSINSQQLIDGVVVATVGDANTVDLNVENIPKTVGLLGTTPQQKTNLVGVFNPKVRFDANGVLTGTPALYCISSSTAPRARSWTAAGVTFKDSGEADGSIACP